MMFLVLDCRRKLLRNLKNAAKIINLGTYFLKKYYMDKLQIQANQAMDKLKWYRLKYKQGKMSLGMVKELSPYYIEVWERYAKLKSKEHKVIFKPFSLIGFLR